MHLLIMDDPLLLPLPLAIEERMHRFSILAWLATELRASAVKIRGKKGCLNRPQHRLDEGAREEGGGCVVGRCCGDRTGGEVRALGVFISRVRGENHRWIPISDVNFCPSVTPQMESGSVDLMKSICELG
jgi:hypothetical protein